MTSLQHWSYAAEGVMAPVAGTIRITPTRRYIERRFPTLGFTVDPGGHPFFEVFLASDRALFDPANAARRSAATFYASREHSGLLRAGDEATVYLVPSAVVRRFAGAREIYYTVACYASAKGENPTFAIPPAQLAREAPSVGVASDFQGQALSMSLAIPAAALERVRDQDDEAPAAAPGDPDAMASAYADPDHETDADRAGGEDGYGLTAALDYDDDYGPMSGEQAVDEMPDGPAMDGAPASEAGLDYDDGYDDPIAAAAVDDEDGRRRGCGMSADGDGYSTMQQSTYAAGSTIPSMLEDEDEGRRDGDGMGAAAAYGDESDEAEMTPAYQAFGAPIARTPREERRIVDTVLSVGWPCQDYAATIPDTEPTAAPPAGLSFGIVPFMQWSGALGELLKTMSERDPRTFHSTFGPKAGDLLQVTAARKEADRLKAVESKELWKEPWLARFKRAGAHKPFQAAQNQAAAHLLLEPVIQPAYALGLNSDRGLVMVTAIHRHLTMSASASASQRDNAAQSALDATLIKIVDAASPLKTDAQRGFAVNAVGPAFMRAQHIDSHLGWTPLQHLAILGELRRIGRSPVPLPTRPETLDLLVSAAATARDPWAAELAQLRRVACLRDVEYA